MGEEMKIWVGVKETYNSGHPIGKWVYIPDSEEEINNVLESIKSEAEERLGIKASGEFYIGETENIPFEVEESDDIHEVNKKVMEIGF